MINDQLSWYDWINFRWIAAHVCNRITQASQVNQSSLTQNVVTDHACGIPWKIEVLFAFDELFERVGERGWITAANQLFCEYFRCVG